MSGRRPIAAGLLLLVAAVALAIPLIQRSQRESEPIHIAFAGPMTGDGAAAGQMMTRAIQLYLDEINEQGGINGRRVELKIYDDQDDPETARVVAQQIVDDGQAVAVIGHWFSSSSIAAGDIYRENQIPAISPGSVDPQVTADNDWYFRSIYTSDVPGRFIAHYSAHVLQRTAVTLIHEDLPYGANLANAVGETAATLNLEVNRIGFETGDPELADRFDEIVEEVQQLDNSGVIVLAVHATEAHQLVQRIRDAGLANPIIGGSSLSEQTFVDGLRKLTRSSPDADRYSRQLYVTTPFLFDTANELAQRFRQRYELEYQELPDWSAAFAHDAALVLATQLSGLEYDKDLAVFRSNLRDSLAAVDRIDRAVLGVTGPTFFTAQGDALKPAAIGQFRQDTMISALTQLELPASALTGTEQANAADVVTTAVVYTGVKIDNFSEIDFGDMTCSVQGEISFRHQDEVDFSLLVFQNAVEPFDLGEPIIDTVDGAIRYRRYQFKQQFKMDFLPDRSFGEHFLGVSFRHRDLSRHRLVFVPDLVGMGVTASTSLKQIVAQQNLISPNLGWRISDVLFFQDTIDESAMGNPELLATIGGVVPYSRFNAAIRIEQDAIRMRRQLDQEIAQYVLVAAISLSILMLMFRRRLIKGYIRTYWWMQLLLTGAFLLTIEVLCLEYLLKRISTRDLENVILVFDTLWFLIGAGFVCSFFGRFVFDPLERATGQALPGIIRKMFGVLVYTFAMFGIVAFVFDQAVTGLLATSGVFAMIIGLAIQINISNIFSGIAINLERNFRIGDWVKIGDFPEGEVIDITWRTIRVKTRFNTVLSIPNSTASESLVENFHDGDKDYWVGFTIHIDPKQSPDRVEKLLQDAVMETSGLHSPWVMLSGVNDWSADYWVYGIAEDYQTKLIKQAELWHNALKHLRRAGIAPAVQRQDVHMFRGVEFKVDDPRNPLYVIHEVDLFKEFSEEDMLHLANSMEPRSFHEGDAIVTQGEEGDSLFVIVEGAVGVRIKVEDDKTIEVARMGSGAVFGEMALLTGEPRSASIVAGTECFVYEISKSHIAPMIESNPRVAEMLSEELTRRTVNRESQKQRHAAEQIDEKTIYQQFLGKIKSFFSVDD